jgi:hypothetical protein
MVAYFQLTQNNLLQMTDINLIIDLLYHEGVIILSLNFASSIFRGFRNLFNLFRGYQGQTF